MIFVIDDGEDWHEEFERVRVYIRLANYPLGTPEHDAAEAYMASRIALL